MHRSLLALGLCLALSSACGDSAPTAPTPSQTIDLTGNWRGNITVSSTAASMVWTLTQTGTAVSGPVILVLPTGTVLLNGALTGTVNGSALTYAIAVNAGGIPAQPQCVGQLGGTMTAAIGAVSTMSGSLAVATSTCATGVPAGTITLTKQ